MAWLSGWLYRKPLVLTGGASGAQSDFQLAIAIAHVTGKMQADFDDIRFTEADGITLVDAWLEAKVDDTSADTWAEFPTTPANTVEATYYMYYGKADAVSDWDIRATMLDGDDFLGASLDTNIWWRQYCDAVVSGGILTLDNFTGVGGRYVGGILGKILIGPSVVTEVRINNVYSLDRAGTFGLGTHYDYTDGDENGIWHFAANNEQGANVDNGSLSLTGTANPFSYNTYYKYTTIHTGSTVHYYRDDVEITGSPLATNMPDTAMYMKIVGDASYSPTLIVDWIFSRKYAANPPTYEFGAEESAPSGSAIPVFIHHMRQQGIL